MKTETINSNNENCEMNSIPVFYYDGMSNSDFSQMVCDNLCYWVDSVCPSIKNSTNYFDSDEDESSDAQHVTKDYIDCEEL